MRLPTRHSVGIAARHGIRDMGALQQRASEDPGNWYWGASADDLGMRWFRRYDEVLDLSDGVEFAHFFAGGRLNGATTALITSHPGLRRRYCDRLGG